MDKEDVVIYAREYYSIIRKKEILPFVTRWMDLEAILISEVRQIKTNTEWSHLNAESTKINPKKPPKTQTHKYGPQIGSCQWCWWWRDIHR